MARTSPGSFRLFGAFGIDVFVHWSWFLVAVILLSATRGQGFVMLGLQAAIYLSLFGIVLMHEFGHALACRSVGGRARHIVLWPLGGVAFVEPPQRPGALLWSIAAGPLVNVALLPVTFGAYAAVVGSVPHPERLGAWAASFGLFQRYVLWVTSINLSLLVFNLLPIYPLDGGQIVQAILWFFLGRARSLKITAGFGLVVAIAVAIPLLLAGKVWLLILAVFVGWQAWRGLQVARVLAAQEAQEAQEAMEWRQARQRAEGPQPPAPPSPPGSAHDHYGQREPWKM